jgi:superfamily II DNA or RNA helicase
MTSPEAAPQSPPPPQAARQHLLESLDEQISRHEDHLAHRGRELASGISELRWSSEARRFSCSLGENGSSCRIELDLPFALGDPMQAACDCLAQETEGSLRRCEHTFAALTRLAEVMRAPGESPLLDDVLRLDPQPAWERTLAALDQFLEGEDEDDTERRLSWRVSFSARGVDLAAWEQRVSRQDGTWTQGRRLGWERLRSTPELWACAADRRAVRALREQVEEHDGLPAWAWTLDVFAALKALAGHPLVFHADSTERRLTVERVEVRLELTTSEAGLLLDATLDSRPLRSFPRGTLHEDEAEHGLLGLVDDRLLVATADHRVLQFLRSLNEKPRLVPPEGQDELLRRLTRLENFLPIELPPELEGEKIESDGRLYLRLSPAVPRGLVAQVRLRPAPCGLYCQPGEGPRRVSGVERAHRVIVERRFEEELALAHSHIGALGLDAYAEERPWQWRLGSDDEALDLIRLTQDLTADDTLLVEWPAGGDRKVAARLDPAALKIEVETRADWFSLKANVEVDGWRLPLLALLKALRRGRRYVRLADGEWAEITESFRERLAAFDDHVHVNRNRLEIDATGASALCDLAGDEATLHASHSFRQLTRRLDETDHVVYEIPPGLQAELRPYQLTGYRWMRRLADWGVGGCLADDMGLGKTVQTLALLLARVDEGPALVVAPTSLGFNWARESGRFTPSLRVILYNACDRQAVVRKLGKGDIVVVSYGLLVREVENLARVRWGTLVLDEAQAIKNAQTKTAQAVRKIRAKWSLALSGTPIENSLGELWSLFRGISPGLLGSWKRFRERFGTPIEKEGDNERRQALSRLVRPFILRRTKGEVLHELPARTEADLYCELSSEERELYEDVRLKALVQLATIDEEAATERFQVLAALTRLRQLACHPALADAKWKKGSAKLELFIEVVNELREGGHRALVFSQFTKHLAILRETLEARGVSYQYLDGSTPIKERMRRVDAFQDGDDEIFLISLMAGGTGLNLTAADYVIHMDPWWNPAVEDQATDRAHRMGQKRPVTVYRLVARGTIEEEILKLHADKRDLVAGVLDGADQAGRLSTSELISMIRTGGDEEE